MSNEILEEQKNDTNERIVVELKDFFKYLSISEGVDISEDEFLRAIQRAV